MTSRRVFVAGSIALTAFAGRAAKSPPPPKIGAIYWPGPTHDLHGFMAVPAKARGPQPAVLVLPGPAGADQFALGLTDALALAGFVACVPKTPLALDECLATLRWLATNPFATGKVAAVGFGDRAGLVDRLSAAPDARLSCGVVFGDSTGGTATAVPILRLPGLTAGSDPASYAQSWQQAMGFLDAHLLPPRKP